MRALKSTKNKVLFLALIVPLILSGCGGGRFDTAESTSLVLPPVIQYSDKTLDKALEEAKGGQCVAHVELGKDYLLTRDRLRVAHEEINK